jgi:3D (Asp-Asp-Asp) domain-containing protein
MDYAVQEKERLMRSKLLFPCLILLSLSLACSNKTSDQSANNTGGTSQEQPATTSNSPSTATTSSGTAAPTPAENAVRHEEKPAAAAPLVIPEGTAITVRLQNALSSGTNQTGDSFDATVADAVALNGKPVIPAGSAARGTVAEAKAKGKIKGDARLRLELTQLTINGSSYPIQSSMSGFSQKGKGKRTAVASGGGAALGAIIGGIAGGGKGAAIGALVGGGAGLAGGTFTGNKQIELPAETALTFKLSQPVTLK